MEFELEFYVTPSGKCPFDVWMEEVHDVRMYAKIFARLDRLKLGNFGDVKSLGEGIGELRIHYGPGIRIYYSKIGNKVILLLCGGMKSSQTKDINKAKDYLAEYHQRERKHGKK